MDSSKMDSSKMDIAEATANLNRLQEQLEKGGDKSKALTEVIVLTRDYIVKIDQSEAVRSHVVQLVQMFWVCISSFSYLQNHLLEYFFFLIYSYHFY